MVYDELVIRDIVFVHNLNKPHLIRWHSRRHAHEEYEFHYFLGGAGRFENGNTTRSIRRGALHISAPGEIHEIHVDDIADPLSYYAVLFGVQRESHVTEVLQDPQFAASFPLRLGTRQRILFEDLKNKYAHADSSRVASARHQLAAFLYDLHAGVTQGRRTPLDAGEYEVHLERALTILQRRIAESMQLTELAAAVGVTPEHLIRLFVGRFGITPMQYYRRLKLEAAGSLLLNGRLSIKEIAWEVGYANPFHFSRAFKAFSGVSPSVYRRDYYRKNPVDYAVRVL